MNFNSSRFTIKCQEELGVPLLSIPEAVKVKEHLLLSQANYLKSGIGEGGLEKIKSIDDNVFYKCKPNQLSIRGAIWIDTIENNCIWWIVSAAKREEGSKKDFYSLLEDSCTRAQKEQRKHNPSLKSNKRTSSDHLKPEQRDYDRLEIEKKYSKVLLMKSQIEDTYRRSLQNPNIPLSLAIDNNILEITTTSKNYDMNEVYLLITFNNHYHSDFIKFVINVLSPEDWNHTSEDARGKIINARQQSSIYMIIKPENF